MLLLAARLPDDRRRRCSASLLEPAFGAVGVVVGIVFEIIVVLHVRRGRAEDVRGAAHASGPRCACRALLVFVTDFAPLRVLTRGFIGLANVVLPGKGSKQGPFVTEEEILTMADVAAEEASIETEERELIHSIFEFGDTVVREVMVPRPDMVAVEADATVDEAIASRSRRASRGSRRTTDTTDNIVGLVFLKDLVARSAQRRGQRAGAPDACARRTSCPSRSASPSCCARCRPRSSTWRSSSTSTAAPPGLVTMEDLLEEIVGEITDEYDVDEPQVERLAGRRAAGARAARRSTR